VAGPSIKGGVVGKHLSLSDLDGGDLRLHTDFRQVYATLLGGWLGCDSKAVLGAKWDQVKEARAQGVRSALRCRFPMTPAFPAELYSAGQMIPRPVASMTGVSRHMIGG
jgi:hypothetical protein